MFDRNLNANHVSKLVMLPLSIVMFVLLTGCDSPTEPDNRGESCIAICDTVDQVNLDSCVVISTPMKSESMLIFLQNEYALTLTSYLIIYDTDAQRIAYKRPPTEFDVQDGKLIYYDSWGIRELDLRTGDVRDIVVGYRTPSYSADSTRIIVRQVGSTYYFDLDTRQVSLIGESKHIREYKPDVLIEYDNGFKLIDLVQGTRLELAIEGMPSVHGALGYNEWDIDKKRGIIAAQYIYIDGNKDSSALYEIDIESRQAMEILGSTDNYYTPRYSVDSEMYYSRTCAPERSGYLLEYSRNGSPEKIRLRARMDSIGGVEYTYHPDM
ncbi:hypothetical protein KQI65_01860 [bacterium]|nr:hypothetical protein [bacterium]